MNPDFALKACLLLTLTVALAGCYVHYTGRSAPGDAATQVTRHAIEREIRDIVYSAPGWPQTLRGDLYLPRKSGALPVVLTVHGGSWASRSRADMASIARRLAESGYAVFNLDYRFAPEFRYPAQINDLQQALAWVTDNAERYQLDVERINAWGFSSGAHLAALLGGIQSEHPDEAVAKPLPRLRAVVAGGIPADLRVYDDSPIVKAFMGGVPTDMPERYAEASPLYHVSSDDPAVFLYHGKLDSLVSPQQTTDYYAALVAAGIDAELFLHRWRGHVTMFLFGGAAEDHAIEFLDRKNRPS